MYIEKVVRLHGVKISIISDKGPQFTTNFWKSFMKCLGTQVNLSTTFHPPMNAQAERTIRTLEDMLLMSPQICNYQGEYPRSY